MFGGNIEEGIGQVKISNVVPVGGVNNIYTNGSDAGFTIEDYGDKLKCVVNRDTFVIEREIEVLNGFIENECPVCKRKSGISFEIGVDDFGMEICMNRQGKGRTYKKIA